MHNFPNMYSPASLSGAAHVAASLAHTQKLTPLTDAKATRNWVTVGSSLSCDTSAGEIYRNQSPGKLPSLEACKKSCEDDAGCRSISYMKTGWCSHFSTRCIKTTFANKAVALRLDTATTQGSNPATPIKTTTFAQTARTAQAATQPTQTTSPGQFWFHVHLNI